MFFRIKKSGPRAYVQVVENRRVDGAVRQSVVANLGRADDLIASGALASLLASGAKLTDQVLLISALEEDADGLLSVAAKRIGGPLLFGQIWDRLGIAAVLEELLSTVHSSLRPPPKQAASLQRMPIGSSLRFQEPGCGRGVTASSKRIARPLASDNSRTRTVTIMSRERAGAITSGPLVLPAYSGMLSCFFSGISSVLVRSMESAWAIRRRVKCGMITSSI